MEQTTASTGLDILGMLEDWRFWVGALGWLLVHVAHNAVLQWRMRVQENRMKRLEDKVFFS